MELQEVQKDGGDTEKNGYPELPNGNGTSDKVNKIHNGEKVEESIDVMMEGSS